MPECQWCTENVEELAEKTVCIRKTTGGCVDEFKVCTLCYEDMPKEFLKKGTVSDLENGVWIETAKYHNQRVKDLKRQASEIKTKYETAVKAREGYKKRKLEKTASNKEDEDEEEPKKKKAKKSAYVDDEAGGDDSGEE
jgi:hypothetical protein